MQFAADAGYGWHIEEPQRWLQPCEADPKPEQKQACDLHRRHEALQGSALLSLLIEVCFAKYQ